jgi:hypothetical protein
MKYKFGGREKLLALGEWPHTSLKRARDRRDEAHRLLADGIDPAAKKKSERAAIADTFCALAREYLDTKRDSFNPKTLSKALQCPPRGVLSEVFRRLALRAVGNLDTTITRGSTTASTNALGSDCGSNTTARASQRGAKLAHAK